MTNKTNNIGCNNLIDNAFVPNCEGNVQNRLREEAQAPVVLKVGDLFSKGFKVDKKRIGNPEEGLNNVTFSALPEVKEGKSGAYMVIELENALGLCWKTYVNSQYAEKMLQDISYYNEGMLAGLTPMKALNKLTSHVFSCWILNDENGKVVTYFNEDKYNRRLYAMELNRERQKPEAPAPEKAPWEEK